MNIPTILYSAASKMYSRLTVSATARSESGTASSDTGDSVLLTQSMNYESSTYTAEISTGASSRSSSDETAASSDAKTTVETSNASSISQFRKTYLNLLAERVQYLLESIGTTGSSAVKLSLGDIVSDSASQISFGESYYSADQTAARIVSFALSFYDGGDREEFADMAGNAVMKGYYKALDTMGGSLPSVSEKTISIVMDELERFASGEGFNSLI